MTLTNEDKRILTSQNTATFSMLAAGTYKVPYAILADTYTASTFGALNANITVVSKYVNGAYTSHVIGVPLNDFTIDSECNDDIYVAIGAAGDITFSVTPEITYEDRISSPTWDEATMTWNEAIETWETQSLPIWSKETKNAITLTNESK